MTEEKEVWKVAISGNTKITNNVMAKNENKKLSAVEVQNLLKDIRKKIKKGVSTLELKHYLTDTYGYAEHTAENYISKARKELKEYYLKDKEHFAEEFYEKYNYLYNSLVEEKKYAAARKILDSQVKISGLLNDSATVQLDSNSKVTISFGFNNNNEEE